MADAAKWEENFADAVKRAQSEDKDLFLEFTGSDWCATCIRLEKEIFATEEFAASASENFVLVKLDYPQAKKQPEALAEQNDLLLNRFQIEVFPTVLLLDRNERPYGSTGYTSDGAKNFPGGDHEPSGGANEA